MRIEYPDVYEAITNGVTVGRRQGYPEGSRPPGICHLTGTAQVIPHNRNLPPVKVWRAVREFILHGVECIKQDPRHLQERLYQNNSDFVKSLHEYSKQIQKSDWNGLSEEERIAQNEDIYTEAGVNNFYQDAINIAFEMGLRSGLHLSKQSDFSEEG